MSIESRIDQEELRLAKFEDRRARLEDYLNSDRVKELFTRFFNSSIDEPYFIEYNDKFRLYLSRRILELYEYRKVEVDKSLTNIPILRSVLRRSYITKELSHDSVFRLEFEEDGSYKIDRLVPSLTADDLIEALDELLFTK